MIYLLLAVAAISAACALAAWIADDTVTIDDEPDQWRLNPADECMVADCPREWQTERHGWRTCNHHARELADRRGDVT